MTITINDQNGLSVRFVVPFRKCCNIVRIRWKAFTKKCFNGFCYPPTEISSGQNCVVTMAVLVHWIRDCKRDVQHGCINLVKAFEECIYRSFGAPSLIRHNHVQSFMSEVFQAFSGMIQA
ncbi:hypothetical protein PHMEG_00011118 [Phytophthora megakarya]|uniref:Uncharacterized protein n=1 Tax=Phytophthora megakarya TaxID=4795 RepID=A0A225WDG3_9STRA|nr:hypothetical protein PHMEG_00011118 [Phytophthora megakarya]